VKPASGGAAVLTVTPTRVVQGAGQSPDFEGYALRDTLPTRTRIYFNSDTLPFPFLPGARVTVSSAGSLNNTYRLVDVREDPVAMVPYLLLPVAYPGSAQRIDLVLSTPYVLQQFDTWQAVLPFNSVPEGCHQVHITVNDSDFSPASAISEPLDVAGRHPNTVVILYRNFDNGFNLNYTAGLINRLRVVGRFFNRQTATQKDVLRESTGKLLLLSAAAQRKIMLETLLLPGWMHEKLAVAFCHDFVRVNDLEVIAEDAYQYEATPNYTLSKGSVLLEQIDFLGAGNRDDVGDVGAGDVRLLVNSQFLKVNP
jgi:hypothetical protein